MRIPGILVTSHTIAAIFGSAVVWSLLNSTSGDPSTSAISALHKECDGLPLEADIRHSYKDNRNHGSDNAQVRQRQEASSDQSREYVLGDAQVRQSQEASSDQSRENQPDSEEHFAKNVIHNLLDTARTDPLAAISWLFSDDADSARLRHAYPFERREAVRNIFTNIRLDVVPEALSLLSSYDDPALTGQALVALLERNQQVISPATILSDIPNYAVSEQTAHEVEKMVLHGWGRIDDVAARDWVLANQSGDERQTAILAVAEGGLLIRPESSLEWAEANVDTPLRQITLEYLFNIWASRDPEAAGEWLQYHSPDPEITSIMENYAVRPYDQNQLSGQEWIAGIQDEAVRYRVQEAVEHEGRAIIR